MELEALKSIWSDLDQKLDRNWKLNMEVIRNTNLDKAKGKMRSLVFVISTAIAFYGVFAMYLAHLAATSWNSWSVVASCVTLGIWSLAIVIASIHELVMINEVNYSESIILVQKKVTNIKLAIIKYMRIGAWILPFHFAFVILFFKILFDVDIVEVGDKIWLLSNLAIGVVVFLPAAIWIHRKLSPENADKDWMNAVLQGQGSQINDAIKFMDEIRSFENSK